LCQLTDAGKPIRKLHNVLRARRNDPALSDHYAFDELERCVVKDGQPLTDSDAGRVHEHLQVKGLTRVSSDTVHQAVGMYARGRGFPPVRDYMNGLEGDGTERLGTWLAKYCQAELGPDTEGVGRAF